MDKLAGSRLIMFFWLLGLHCLTWAQQDTVLYSFFVAGHTYGLPDNLGLHPPFRAKFTYIQSRPEIKFGVLTGDIVDSNPTEEDWDAIDADINSLGLPVYFTLGNHDSENLPLFESRYGPSYYSFDYENDLFIVLDPNLDSWNISGDQLAFLKNVVEENTSSVQNIYVFFHQILWREKDSPFRYIAWNSPVGRADTINFWNEVEPLFRVLPNQVFMFAGDLGSSWSSDVTYDHYDNITLIATGMGDPDGENFIVVNVNNNKEVQYDLICLSDPSLFCLGELTDFLRVDEIVATASPTLKNQFIIFPNPAHNQITVSTEFTACDRLRIFDLLGHLMLDEECLNDTDYEFDASGWPRGIYQAVLSKGYIQKMTNFVLN